MSLFESFVTQGNERADELAKDEAIWDGGEMAQIRASTVKLERGPSFPLLGGGVARV